MSLWESSEVLSKDKLNLKTAYIGSTPPTNPVNGQIWVDTSNAGLFIVKIYRNGSWDAAKGASVDKVTAPPAASAYSTPIGVSASSETPHVAQRNGIGQAVSHLSTHRSQKTSFYAAGRYWIFYSPNSGAGSIYYVSSTDLVNWTTPTALDKQTTTEHGWDTWFDGTYLHIILREYNTVNIYYRRAQPNSDGTLTWSADWQLVTSVSLATDHRICCDENRYAFVFIRTAESMAVLKNRNNDGTWVTESSWSIESAAGWGALGSFATGGRMLLVYTISSTKNLYIKLYDGSNWGTSTQIGTAYYDNSFTTPYRDPYDGTLHLHYLASDNNARDIKVTSTGSWSENAQLLWGIFGADERGILHIRHGIIGSQPRLIVRRLLDGVWSGEIDAGLGSDTYQQIYSGSPSQTYVYSYTQGSASPYNILACIFKQQYPAVDVKDDFASSAWQPNPPNQQNAWIRFDLTGSAIGGVAGCRIYHNSDANYRPQAYKIQGSEDGSSWEDLHTQSTQPPSGWIEHSWDPKPSIRYLRLLITQHGSSGTRVNEFDYYQSSIWRHGHRGD